MNSKENIIALADSKLIEAIHLSSFGFYDSAYYLGGYVIELLFKAKICDHFEIDDFFEPVADKYLERDALKPFKVHDLMQLLIFSGIFRKAQANIRTDDSFKNAWSVVRLWNESSRYEQGKDREFVMIFLDSVKIIQQWITTYL